MPFLVVLQCSSTSSVRGRPAGESSQFTWQVRTIIEPNGPNHLGLWFKAPRRGLRRPGRGGGHDLVRCVCTVGGGGRGRAWRGGAGGAGESRGVPPASILPCASRSAGHGMADAAGRCEHCRGSRFNFSCGALLLNPTVHASKGTALEQQSPPFHAVRLCVCALFSQDDFAVCVCAVFSAQSMQQHGRSPIMMALITSLCVCALFSQDDFEQLVGALREPLAAGHGQVCREQPASQPSQPASQPAWLAGWLAGWLSV